ncbi:hypothetical protein GGD41_000809 [Paraburkholderia bryophila]|uniref:Uncharacterized protein n=1 Tax=Paraburkholderia bryophila TaxID=420952 RepID=A0A7Z0AXH6_9BURK|nr:hypothetical protein [Paraburkholderia bryophila]
MRTSFDSAASDAGRRASTLPVDPLAAIEHVRAIGSAADPCNASAPNNDAVSVTRLPATGVDRAVVKHAVREAAGIAGLLQISDH